MPLFNPKPDDHRPSENRWTAWLSQPHPQWHMWVMLGVPALIMGAILLLHVSRNPPNAMPLPIAWQAYREANCKVTRVEPTATAPLHFSFACADGRSYTSSTLDTPPTDWVPPK